MPAANLPARPSGYSLTCPYPPGMRRSQIGCCAACDGRISVRRRIVRSAGMVAGRRTDTIRAGFDRITPGLARPAARRVRLLKAFRQAQHTGDPRFEREAIAGALAGCAWEWPSMKACAAEFEWLGIWPGLWRGDCIPPPFEWDSIPVALCLELLGWTSWFPSFRLSDRRTKRLLRTTKRLQKESEQGV